MGVHLRQNHCRVRQVPGRRLAQAHPQVAARHGRQDAGLHQAADAREVISSKFSSRRCELPSKRQCHPDASMIGMSSRAAHAHVYKGQPISDSVFAHTPQRADCNIRRTADYSYIMGKTEAVFRQSACAMLATNCVYSLAPLFICNARRAVLRCPSTSISYSHKHSYAFI